jgi:hypothetical protein
VNGSGERSLGKRDKENTEERTEGSKEGKKNEVIVEMSEMCLRASFFSLSLSLLSSIHTLIFPPPWNHPIPSLVENVLLSQACGSSYAET